MGAINNKLHPFFYYNYIHYLLTFATCKPWSIPCHSLSRRAQTISSSYINNIIQEAYFSDPLGSYSPTRRQSLNVYHKELIPLGSSLHEQPLSRALGPIQIYIRESIQAFISPQLILTFFLLSYHYVYLFRFRFGVRLQALPAINTLAHTHY